jgi:hypothetical protein
MKRCWIGFALVVAACGPDTQAGDPDTDGDGILDRWEGNGDFDGDGTPNFMDLDSDGDCRPDEVESGITTAGAEPVDTDGDGRWDFLDHDSDDDGVADMDEDADCSGTQNGDETSATDADSDNDGVTDLVEDVAGTDPLDPTDNPQAHGNFVFVEPFDGPQMPLSDDLDFSSYLIQVDAYLLIDRSTSMSTELDAVKTNLAAAITAAQCAPLGTGTPPDCIPDLWAGAGTFTWQYNEPFASYVPIQPTPDFSVLPGPFTDPGTNTNEDETFAMWATITGLGSADATSCTLATVPAAPDCTGSPADLGGFATFGYPCFREGSLPVVLIATDEAPIDDAASTYECPLWPVVATAYNARRAKVIGIKGDNLFGNVQGDFVTMTTDTGSVDATTGAPFIYDGSGAAAADAIAQGLSDLANNVPLDLTAVPTDDGADQVDAPAAFIDHMQTLQLGSAACAAGLDAIDTDGDGHLDAYQDVRTGTPVCWSVVTKPNHTVQATADPQLFHATVEVFGDGVTELDSRDVYFLVPPAPFDPPI